MTIVPVQDFEARLSVVEEKARNTDEMVHRLREEMERAGNRRDSISDKINDRLSEVETMVGDLKTNTALTRQALDVITAMASDNAKDRQVAADWRAKQDEKWAKIDGAKWVFGVAFALLIAVAEGWEHILHFFK